MREIHQFVHTLSYGDAISGEVLSLQRCLQEAGHVSEIYAINCHPLLEGKSIDYREFNCGSDAEVILHYSIGSPLNELYRKLTACSRTLLYHNLTPPEWFEGVNPRIVEDIKVGQVELPELCQLSDRLIADSQFNAGELAALGFDATVLPLPIDNQKWGIATNSGIAKLLQESTAKHFLHVGRLAPNKCVEDIIKTFYFYHHKIDRDSILWLAGIDIDTELYSFSLKRLVEELDLVEAVRFLGCMADSELKALYENSHAYICMSEHEGFCLPLIEAMYFELPVVAYASSAVPDTLGDGGVLIKEKRHHEIAELLHRIVSDREFATQLKKAGRSRVREAMYDNFKDRVRELFSATVESVKPMVCQSA